MKYILNKKFKKRSILNKNSRKEENIKGFLFQKAYFMKMESEITFFDFLLKI